MNFLKTLTAAVFMAISISAAAKDYTPTTNWPYIYENFQKGCVTNLRGIEVHHEQLNISLIKGEAHYLQDDQVMKVDMLTISSVTIGNDKYIPVSGKLVKILRETEHGITAVAFTIDIDEMERIKGGTGYGGGSPISTSWGISTRSLEGTVSTAPQKVSEISKKGGEDLILKKRRGIIRNGMLINATKQAILGIHGLDKDAVKKFMKDNKIKLTDDEDLSKLAEFIGTL